MELHEKVLTKRLALSVDVVRTIKKRRYGRLLPVKNAVENPPEVTRSDKLRSNRAFQHNWTSQSDYENHKTVSYFR